MIKIGMVIGDRYEILEKIGTGGMSDVYKAKDGKLNRFVAVKVLKQEFSENANFVSKFRTEAQAAAGMMHPNIVNVYDVGEEGGIYYIVMELVEGITLKKYIEKKARLSIKETISIAIQVSMGIEAAHNNHIIHRDIKPQNIMISKEGKVKVTDFGIAKAVSSNTITSNVMGSVHYTSPEQARGGFSDEKSDIYSLGVTMFEMLTGRVPFNGETTVAIAIKHIQEPMPSPREYVAEIPISVEQIVFKCTQKSPDRRYQNMAELIADLKKSLMKPDEDFVKMVNPDEEAATRTVTEQDMATIKSQVKKRIGDDEPQRIHSGDTGKINTKNSKSGSRNTGKKPVNKNNTKKTPAKKNRPDSKRKVSSQEEHDEMMEKITTIAAIVAAVLIGIAVIYFAGRAFGLFGGGSQTEEPVVESISPGVTNEVTPEKENEDKGTAKGVEIPDVTGLSYAEAVATLNKAGFDVEKVFATSDTVPKDDVIDQSPLGKERAERGSTVILTVSTGTAVVEVKMPSIIGLSEEDATIKLVESGLSVGSVTETTDPDPNLADKVCYQSYAEGVVVNGGTKVDIKISTGTGVVVYKYVGNVESPGSGEKQYVPGTEATVVLTTIDGQELKRETVTSFPVSMNVLDITGASEGVITIEYYVTIPGTTIQNEDGTETTTEASTEKQEVRIPVKFTEG